jgi:cell filamentation protein
MRGLAYKATGKQGMKAQPKLSIRFFNDREVRAVWDDKHSKWWFNVLDIVGVLNEEPDYAKVRNYWKYLKAKLKKENNQLVSATTQLKFMAADGKKIRNRHFR